MIYRSNSLITEPDNRLAHGYPVLLSQLTFEVEFAIIKNRNDSDRRNAHMDTLIVAVGIFAGIVFGVWKLILIIAKKHDRNVSPYLIFGIVDIVCGLVVVGFAMYDILTPGGDLNGMLGQILLLIFVPTVIVLLIADIFLWHNKTKKKD